MKSYLDKKSNNQDLKFTQLKDAFDRCEISDDQIKSVLEKLVDYEENYTNLALILSNNNPHTIKMAFFDNDFSLTSKIEFMGSILQQYADIYEYLEEYQNDYPLYAIREIIGNAIVHRDYSFDSSTLIHIHPEHIEITSTGGLLDGFKRDDVLNGVCITRNKKLSEIFSILGITQGCGFGLKRVQSIYRDYDKDIGIVTTMNSFKMIIPNLNACKPKVDRRILTNKEKQILDLLEEFTELTELELEEKMDIRQSRSYLLTKTLAEKGYIVIEGKGNTRKYKLKEQ